MATLTTLIGVAITSGTNEDPHLCLRERVRIRESAGSLTREADAYARQGKKKPALASAGCDGTHSKCHWHGFGARLAACPDAYAVQWVASSFGGGLPEQSRVQASNCSLQSVSVLGV